MGPRKDGRMCSSNKSQQKGSQPSLVPVTFPGRDEGVEGQRNEGVEAER